MILKIKEQIKNILQKLFVKIKKKICMAGVSTALKVVGNVCVKIQKNQFNY